MLEDRNKKGHLVSGQYLGTILYDETSLQLVLLNSCSGGRTSVTDPFAGVGQSLLQKGIPAVIAMQFEITDEAAITFSHEFYAALVDGYSIDAAVAEARKMIYAEANQLEWATPVLYTSIDSGSLLREPSAEELELLEKQRQQREETKHQEELKRQQREEEARQSELKRQQAEAEAKQQADIKQQQAAAEVKRQAELKRQQEEARQAELQRQQEAEAAHQLALKCQQEEEAAQQLELQRQQEAEAAQRQRQQEAAVKHEAELKQKQEEETKRQMELERQQEAEVQRQPEEPESPLPTLNAVLGELPTPRKPIGWQAMAIGGVVIVLGIGGFFWKSNIDSSVPADAISTIDSSVPADAISTIGSSVSADDISTISPTPLNFKAFYQDYKNGGWIDDGVSLRIPDIAETGSVVPIRINFSLKKQGEVWLSNEQGTCQYLYAMNPSSNNVISYSTRIKMSKSDSILALVKTGGVDMFAISQQIKVSFGGDICQSMTDSDLQKIIKSLDAITSDNTVENQGVKLKASKSGNDLDIKSLTTHPMETGRRKDKKTNAVVPENYIKGVAFYLNKEPIFYTQINSSISKNPYFSVVFEGIGKVGDEVIMIWIDSTGKKNRATTSIE